jgi:hypothetical protein
LRALAGPAVSGTRARLVKPLAEHAEPGEAFYVNTSRDWQKGNCKVPANTVIEGRITAREHRRDGAKKEELDLRFEPIPCEGNETMRVVPVLAAMRGPQPDKDDAGLHEAEMKQAMMSMMVSRPVRTPSLGGSGGPAAMSNAQAIESQGLGGFDQGQRPDLGTLSTGEVRDIKGVKMVLPPAGSDVTSLVSSRPLSLEQGTQFLLVFLGVSQIDRENASAKKPAALTTPDPHVTEAYTATSPLPANASTATPSPSEEQVTVCAAGCTQIDTAPPISGGPAEWSLSLASMGLRPRLGQARIDLDDDASVHFLGSDEILVTFNDHTLTRRSQDVGPRPRHIRAVLFSETSGKILQTQEWPVYDDRQYTWELGGGRVLAHVGHELVIYGPEMAVLSRYKLPGPVAFAEVAPAQGSSQGIVTVVTIHERHSPEAHQKLAAFIGPDWPIDEDYDFTVLDANLNPIGTKKLDSRPPHLALQTVGMVSAQRDRGESWKVEQEDWTGRKETLARLVSGCRIALSSLPGNLLFAKACASDQASTFYWVLNAQGSVLLAGHSPATEIPQQAQSSTSGDVIAIATTQSYEPIDLTVGARVSDFHSLTVSAYRVSDGKKILAAKAAEGSALRQTFSLAPSGEGLAVLSGSTLQAYRLPAQHAPEKTTAQAAITRPH